MSIHLILYSNNEPYNTTKELIIESIFSYTKKKLYIHNYNLDIIKTKDWFHLIMNLPKIYKLGMRDGYYNSWKAFIVKEVYTKMNDDDILYYVDCSQFYKIGFTENIDKLCDIANTKLCIAGSVGNDIKNNTISCCDNIIVWDIIIPNKDNYINLDKLHVLNSWFLIKKCHQNNKFINDWVFYSYYTDYNIKEPLVTYHHTVDRSIFNILVIKYNLPVFYSPNIDHNLNKNKNIVLNIINNDIDIEKYFIYL